MNPIFLVLLGILCSVSTFTFEDPHQTGVEFGNTTTSQNILVDEDNTNAIVKILTIAGVEGDIYLTYDSNIKELLQPLLAKSSTNEYALIVNRLDYETLRTQSIKPNFLIDVFENDISNKQTVNITIRNIDDESPTLSVSSLCAMNEELWISTQFSTCILHVSDPDGFLNSMDFEIEGDIFAVEYKDAPADDVLESDVYLVLISQYLDYETQTFYVIQIEAKDGAGHSATPERVSVLVQVNDIADHPPMWLTPQNSIIIDEETPTTVQFKAVDGDFGINNDINYTIVYTRDFLHIDNQTGLLTIDAIDKDQNFEKITFGVKALEIQDFMQTYSTETFTLIVNDLDDNIPEISVVGSNEKEVNVILVEGSLRLLIDIAVTDLDTEENAFFTTSLNASNPDFLTAFEIVPNQGYKNATFQLIITQPGKLDFENPDWQTITMELHTIGTKTPTNRDILPITINLADINDEAPIFDQDEYIVRVVENVPVGTTIAFIQASDKDAEDADAVQHEIFDSFGNTYLEIEPLGGSVIVINNEVFDYEKQSEIYLQIRATDKANHTTITKLTILLQDVNDENPKLIATRTLQVDEELNQGYQLDTNIRAIDRDATADLVFSIDWEKSYAYKGIEIIEDIRSISVETVSGNNNQEAIAQLSVAYRKTGEFDYELYDTLYLYLTIIDKNTEENEGTDSAWIVIKLQNVNDNPPIFDTEIVAQVTENAGNGIYITTVTASDADFDTLKYEITNGSASTYWVSMDSKLGTIVSRISGANSRIDCDNPVRYQVLYDVTATDGIHTTKTTVTINIVDENDNAPTLNNQQVTIPENVNSGVVLILQPNDNDRDEPNNIVECIFAKDTPIDVLNRFNIDSNSIHVSLSNGATLDREEVPEFKFNLDCFDNPGGNFSNHISRPPLVTVRLADVNDNYPTITNTYITGLTETTPKGPITTRLQTEDLDEGDNAFVEFSGISKISRFLDSDFLDEVNVPQDIIAVSTAENKKEGILNVTTENLLGYYGYLRLEIELHDLGTEPLRNMVNVTLEVLKAD